VKQEKIIPIPILLLLCSIVAFAPSPAFALDRDVMTVAVAEYEGGEEAPQMYEEELDTGDDDQYAEPSDDLGDEAEEEFDEVVEEGEEDYEVEVEE
jgi:hypothetical protein